MAILFGVFVPQGWKMDLVGIPEPVAKFEAMTAVAKAADAGQWDSVWVYDHFHTVPEPTMETTFECWTVSATLARDTARVRIGQMVGCNGYRNPALYAKIASTVDVASHGRYARRPCNLSHAEELTIYALAGTKSLRSLAADFGVSLETVRAVLRAETAARPTEACPQRK